MLKGKWEKQKKKKCEVILQKVEMYKEKKMLRSAKSIKRKDLKKDQSQNKNKNPSYDKK